MDQIAFFWGYTVFYWSSLIIALSAAAGICFFWAFYVGKGNGVSGAAAAVPLAVMLSVVLARLIHWYCRTDSYPSFQKAMTDYSAGGYALAGAFFGCFLTAVLLRLLGASKSLPRMLDCMSLAGCAAIGLGRLSCFFNASDRGGMLAGNVGLPLTFPVVNPVSGAAEQRFAVFLFQAVAAGVIFLAVTCLFLREKENRKLRDGDAALLVLLFYGAAQVVLDSARYDALYLRSNGFVSLVQILSAAAVVGTIGIVSLRLVRANGFRLWYILAWAGMALMLGGAGYMEYYVQRHGDRDLFAYGMMSACMAGTLVVAMLLWNLTIRRERILRLPTIYGGNSQ